jgi:hypothetical protein
MLEDEKIPTNVLEQAIAEELTDETKLANQLTTVRKNDKFDHDDAFCPAKLR